MLIWKQTVSAPRDPAKTAAVPMHDRRRRTRDWVGTFDPDGGRGGLGWAPPLEELLFRLTEAQVNSSRSFLRVRFQIIGNARIKNVCKSQSCMVSKLRIIWKQTVAVYSLVVCGVWRRLCVSD